jgi:hypothetical protein
MISPWCQLVWSLDLEFNSVPFSYDLMCWFWVCRFLLISSGIIYGYYAMILKIDEEDFGGHGALLQEGLFASITLFLVPWHLSLSLSLSLTHTHKPPPLWIYFRKEGGKAHVSPWLTIPSISVFQLAWILVYSLGHFWLASYHRFSYHLYATSDVWTVRLGYITHCCLCPENS